MAETDPGGGTLLGPTQTLRFIGGEGIKVSAINNPTLDCVDITIEESETPISTSIIGPFPRLRFLVIGTLTISVIDNPTLACIDITIGG
jgi:hypothetical protein